MLEKYEVCCGLFHGFDWSQLDHRHAAGAARRCCRRRRSTSSRRRTARTGCCSAVTRAVAGVRARGAARRGAAHPRRRGLLPGGAGGARQARAGRAQDRRGARPRRSGRSSRGPWRPDEVIDIFAAAGLKKPDISILSDEFLAEVRGMPQRNLAVELLQKLLNGEIKTRAAQERRPGAVLRRDAGAGDPHATRTARSRPRR